MRFFKALALALTAAAAAVAVAQSRSADDVYSDAQGALTRSEFTRAIDGFRALRRDFPTSRYVADSFFWEALALERNGDLKGAPSDHIVNVREVRLSAGAEFVVAICGEIMTMPGLPRVPAADSIDVSADGKIVGLF